MKRNLTISLALGFAISAATLYLAFRHVPFSDLLDYLATIDYGWIVPSTLVLLLGFLLRVIRWQIILGATHKVRFWGAFHPMMIGFMMNCVLPGRVGEVARPVILKQKEKVPFTTGLATVATERIFDLALLIAFFALVLAAVDIDPDLSMAFGKYHLNKATLEAVAAGMLRLCIAVIAGIVLVSIESVRKQINRTIMAAPRLFAFAGDAFREKIEKKLAGPLVGITENIASGFSLVKQPKKLLISAGLSLLIWSSAAFSYYIMALGCPGIGLSFLEISAVMIIICFFIALPSVPGFWGLWEAGGVFALALFGIPAKEAAGFTLANHAVQMFPVILVGLVSAVVTGINILQVSRETR